jgi:4-amino-4-deoxy-L-arabinose transferase-like glycosyltransferase
MRYPVYALNCARDTGSLVIGLVLVAGCFFHFLNLDSLPMGFYVDESSIGYNAYLIANTGADEHGVRWPVFFEAFGEYKNPLYIYLLAALYKVLGFSEWTTRCLSALCWLVGTVCLYDLARSLFSNTTTRLYISITLAFTPWLFALSRVSFEVIALFPLLSFHLLALHRGFERRSWNWAVASGAAMGLCLYAYSTFRLLAPLHCIAVLMCYRASKYHSFRRAFMVGALISAVPYTLYASQHFDTLVRRFDRHFDTLTYWNDPTLSVFEKLGELVTLYLGYFTLPFLGLSGDPNLRHHSGFGGELQAGTLVLLIVSMLMTLEQRDDRFRLYLVVGLGLSPVAAALTVDPHHSLRAFSLLVFAMMLSAYPLIQLSVLAARSIVALTALGACLYVVHYFIMYPPQSAAAFENFGFKDTLRAALAEMPNRVVLSSEGNEPYINLRFFGNIEHAQIPLVVGAQRDLRPGDVFISYDPTRVLDGFYHVERNLPGTALTR